MDLIYYNRGYQLFALVQYKLMREEKEEMVYRPDPALIDELSRMDAFSSRFSQPYELQSHEEYRLNSDGFLFKIVPNRGLSPASGELIKGMYLTREYMRFLLGDKGPKGDKGGAVITFDNSPRYLTNSEFTKSVNRGWIGTRGAQSDVLKDLVKQYYETGRAVVLAHESIRDDDRQPVNHTWRK